jgi:iron complex outermembrane receptor protein
VPKVGLRWQPLDDTLTVRASWSEGFRAPSLYELHSTRAALLAPIVNPASGINEPEQFVTIAGNPALSAEKTSFANAGVLWSPQAPRLKGVTVAIDYWQARRRRTVASNFQDTVDRFFAARADRAAIAAGAGSDGLFAGESVVLNGGGTIAAVNSVFLNSGATDAAGIDYAVNGVWRAESFGRLAASATWSQYTHYRRRTAADGGLLERVSQPAPEGTRADDGYLRWRGRLQLEWERGEFSSVWGASYTDGFWDLEALGTPLAVSAQWLCDAQVSYRFLPRRGRLLGNTTLALGARNLFDRAPPFAAGFGNNPVGYPGSLYTGEGRFVYVSLLRRF